MDCILSGVGHRLLVSRRVMRARASARSCTTLIVVISLVWGIGNVPVLLSTLTSCHEVNLPRYKVE
ncbi:hypothetical protein IG631_05604 [Alternaria alternata]|nr:hypothetical protein IG631_05604 [Alternaria alternata]